MQGRRSPVSALLLLLGCLATACGDDALLAPPATTTGTDGGAGGSGPLAVETDHGPIQGTLVGSTRAFLGIPYAAPPVGPLRWKAPADHEPWTSPLAATQVGPECPQLEPLSGKYVSSASEDCLTLNVWTPSAPVSAGAPVLVWIHGGAFVLGSGGDGAYDGRALSEASGAVVVTINYRLGPLGFLALTQLAAEDAGHPSTGGYGIEDQRAALAWVAANAASFGGDPANVTLFGESAGGVSVCHHLVSEKSRGLFHRAILQSGPCGNARDESEGEAQGADLATALGCDGADVLTCLRDKSAEDVLEALPLSKNLIGKDGATWGPVVDGLDLAGAPLDLLESGAFEPMPTLLGSNSDEGTLFLLLGNTKVADDAALAAFAEALYPGQGQAIASHYPSSDYGGDAQKAAAAAVGDAGFVCPTRRAARALATSGAPTFLYHFSHVPDGSLLGDLGAFHSSEIRYVFANPSQLLPQELTDEEKSLAATTMGYWARLARGGDPNAEGAFAWPAYEATSDANIVLDTTVAKETARRKAQCDFWDSLPPPP